MPEYNTATSHPHPHLPSNSAIRHTANGAQNGSQIRDEIDGGSGPSPSATLAAGQPYQPQGQAQLSYAHEHTHDKGLTDSTQQFDGVSTTASGSRNNPDKPKAIRLRKACDACSSRKIKCDNFGPSCKPCAEFGVPCTYDRPSKRRGPKNQQIEAIKRRQLDQAEGIRTLEDKLDVAGHGHDDPDVQLYGISSPKSAMAVATMASLAQVSQQNEQQVVLTAESICPLETLVLLIDDFFLYLHPLCPFPHEPSFRAAFAARQDLCNPKFLALLASMVGVLVASFPRKPRLHLKAQRREHLFPNSISLVQQCHKVAVEARGSGYLDNDPNIYDAITSYFLGLAGAYTFQWQQARLYFGETLTITRVVGAHKADSESVQPTSNNGHEGGQFDEPRPLPIDFIKQQIGRRLFWVMFVSIRSMQQYGALFGELLVPPPTPNDPYPDFPLEVDDQFIYEDRIEPQPAGITSNLVGYNLNIKIYHSVTPLASMELAYGIDQVFDWDKQMRVLEECLMSVKQILSSAPQELLLQPNQEDSQVDSSGRKLYYPPMYDVPGRRTAENEVQMSNSQTHEQKILQFEIQKANIYASQLGTRSYIVEKYWSLHEASERKKSMSNVALTSPRPMQAGSSSKPPISNLHSQNDNLKKHIWNERESIVQDLLAVLSTISQVNMEPNGGSFHNKIRQIASTLIDTPANRKGPLAVRNEEYLSKFLDVLMKLEKARPISQRQLTEVVEDEEEELRNWADLRDYQMRFLKAGGFLNQQ